MRRQRSHVDGTASGRKSASRAALCNAQLLGLTLIVLMAGSAHAQDDELLGLDAPSEDEPAPSEEEAATPEEPAAEPEPAAERDPGDTPDVDADVAQTEPVPEASYEVIVTAQFRKQSAQKTPLAMTVVNAETLEARSQTSLVDVANQAPNVRLSQGEGAYGPAMQAHIRGVGQHDFNFALEPGVGVYVDDVYYSTLTGTNLDLLDLERVEILRGPQGTLAGQNSIGGAVKLYSKPPQGTDTGYVETTYGRYNRTEVRGAADFGIVEDHVFGRISGVATHKDGYVTRYDYACTHPGTPVPSFQISDECELGTEGGKAYAGVRAAVRTLAWDDRLEVNVIGDYTNDASEAAPNTLLYVGTPPSMAGPGGPGVPVDPVTGIPFRIDPMTMMPVPVGNLSINGVLLGDANGSVFITHSPFGDYALDPYTDSPYVSYSTYLDPAPENGMAAPYAVPPDYGVDNAGVSGKIELEIIPDLTVTSITAFRTYQGAWSADDGTPINTYLVRNRVEHEQLSEELRLGGKAGEILDYTVGGFFLDQDSHYGGRIGLRTLQFVEDSDIPASTIAGFANVEWHVLSGLDVIAGGRYTKQKKEFRYGRSNIAGLMTPPAVAPLDGVVGTYEGDRIDWRGAVQYQWIPELMTYAQVATGFKGGGVNPRPFFPTQAVSHEPETLLAYEIGVKSDWLDRRWRVNVAGFVNQYDDILMTVTSCPAFSPAPTAPCLMPINAGQATILGGELETVVHPTDELGIDASFSYLQFEYISISDAGASSGITTDMDAPYAPQIEASAGAQYEIVMGSAGSLTPRLDVSFQDAFYTSPTNTEFSLVDARTLLNGRITWYSPDEVWQASLSITNLTNLVYYRTIRDDRQSSYIVTGQPGPPLEWAFTLKRTFE